jgi:hypothetical protein
MSTLHFASGTDWLAERHQELILSVRTVVEGDIVH